MILSNIIKIQNKEKFISHLSIVDIIMYNDPLTIKNMLEKYRLV